jgi:excisionase family DNA binding protein
MLAPPLQLELFPDFVPAATRAPKLALPWTEREEIDVQRAARILGISKATVLRIAHSGQLRYYTLTGDDSSSRILYESVVDYCDRLRLHYLIPARHKRIPGRRLRDDQVLPFPLAETVGIDYVKQALHCQDKTVCALIDSGDLVAYKINQDSSRGHWRIHLPSVERYIARLHRMARPGNQAGPASRSVATSAG